jgi:hypothetical protein
MYTKGEREIKSENKCPFFRPDRKIAKATISLIKSARPSVRTETLRSHLTDFHEI